MGTSSEGVLTLTPPSYPRGIILGDESQPLQTIYEESSTQNYHCGTKLVYSDGRVFRYAKNGGTALTRAHMNTAEAAVANCVAETQSVSGTSADVGDLEITIDVTNASGITDNLYQDGTLFVESSTGIGDIYKVLACKLLTTTTARILLETPIRTAWAAGTVISLVKNKWYEVDVMPTTAERSPAGINLIDVTANYFCWLQTGGYAPCIVDTSETLVKGDNVGYPATLDVAGCCGIMAADTDVVWGVVSVAVAAAGAALIDLRLDS